jgi:hypothetical protein
MNQPSFVEFLDSFEAVILTLRPSRSKVFGSFGKWFKLVLFSALPLRSVRLSAEFSLKTQTAETPNALTFPPE